MLTMWTWVWIWRVSWETESGKKGIWREEIHIYTYDGEAWGFGQWWLTIGLLLLRCGFDNKKGCFREWSGGLVTIGLRIWASGQDSRRKCGQTLVCVD